MKSRALRFVLHALFVGVVAAAAYVVWRKNSEGTAAAHAARAFDQRANAVSRSLLEIKGAQSGYVAAGQGEDYWVAKVDSLMASVRDGLAALERMTRQSQSVTEIAAAAAAFEDFEQMDRRARSRGRGDPSVRSPRMPQPRRRSRSGIAIDVSSARVRQDHRAPMP